VVLIFNIRIFDARPPRFFQYHQKVIFVKFGDDDSSRAPKELKIAKKGSFIVFQVQFKQFSSYIIYISIDKQNFKVFYFGGIEKLWRKKSIIRYHNLFNVA